VVSLDRYKFTGSCEDFLCVCRLPSGIFRSLQHRVKKTSGWIERRGGEAQDVDSGSLVPRFAGDREIAAVAVATTMGFKPCLSGLTSFLMRERC